MSKALIIIDMWDMYYPGIDRYDRLIEQLSLKLKKLMEQIDMPIVISSYTTPNYELPWTAVNHTITKGLENHTGDSLVSWYENDVIDFLNLHNITDLFFAGVSFPGCVQSRPLGIDAMKENFNCTIVADCVINLLGNEYTEHDIIHNTYTEIISSDYQYICSKDLENK